MTEAEIQAFVADVVSYAAGQAYPLCDDQSLEANDLGNFE